MIDVKGMHRKILKIQGTLTDHEFYSVLSAVATHVMMKQSYKERIAFVAASLVTLAKHCPTELHDALDLVNPFLRKASEELNETRQ